MREKAFVKKESVFVGEFDQGLFQKLWGFWKERSGRILLIVCAALVSRSSFLSISLFLGSWADSLCQNAIGCQNRFLQLSHWQSEDYLRTIFILIGLGFMGSTCFLTLCAATGARVSQKFHNETILRITRFPMSFLDRTPVGHIYTRFSSDLNHLLIANGPHLGQMLMIMLDVTIMLTIITIVDWRFTLAIAPFIVINRFIFKRNNYKIRQKRRAAAASRSPSIAHFSATTKGFLTIGLFGKRRNFVERFHKLVNRYYRDKSSADLSYFLFNWKISLSTACLVLVLSLISVLLISRGELSVGSSGIVISYVALVSAFIQRLFTLFTSLEQGLTGAERIYEYAKKPLEKFEKFPQKITTRHEVILEAAAQAKINDSHGSSLSIKNLKFRYGPDLPWILDDLNLEVQAGQSVGIIGRTGSGKSSLFQALISLYPVHSGTIEIDGKTLSTESHGNTQSLKQWREHFSFITQDPRIFRATIRDNLDPTGAFSDQELENIIERVGLSEWLSKFPLKLQSLLSEDGLNMSAGQRQQLATARCLLQNTNIVLMDEATSSVDPQSEKFFLDATRDLLKTKTRLIIAHRLTTVYDCDAVAWLANGKIKKFGPPQEVIPDFQNSSEASTHE